MDEVVRRVTEICDRNRDALLETVSLLVQHSPPVAEQDDEAEATRRLIQRITAKRFISTNEAAQLLGCCSQHLRNKTQEALDGRALVPIPFLDLDGVLSFPLDELLAWARTPKVKPKKPQSEINQSEVGKKVAAASVTEISSRRSATRLQSAPSTRKGAVK